MGNKTEARRLMAAAGVVLARSRTRPAVVGWSILGTLASLLVLLHPTVPAAAKVLWTFGLAAIVALRRGRRKNELPRHVARAGLASLLLYLGLVYGMARAAENMAAGDTTPIEAQANPVAARPHQHRVVLVYEDRYTVMPPDAEPFDVPRQPTDAVVTAALEAPSVRGFANWMRFPYWETEPQPDGGWLVTIRDLRYVDPGEPARGIGLVQVRLDKELRPVSD